MVAAMSSIADGSPQSFSHFRAVRVLPASVAVTSVTTVTTLGKGSWTYGGYTHAFSGVSVVCERRGYCGYLLTAVTAVIAGPWMLKLMVSYTRELFESIPGLIG